MIIAVLAFTASGVFLLSVMLKINLFDFFAVAATFGVVLTGPRCSRAVLLCLAALLVTVGSYVAFVDYMQHPWFMTDPMNCDGPCFGWYKLEDTIMPDLVILNLESLSGAILGIFARVILRRIRP
ncbi:MAG: hypothetical protein KAR13_14605 [Desulfobulbaceae bacterium]|nr:hypothetical protein [Desulfobulbaceae bacterium]